MKFLVCPRAAQTPLSLQGLRVRGGTGAYVKALLRQLRDTTVKLRAEIISIRKEGPGFFLTEQDGNEHFADQVVLASPAYKTHALLANLAGATRLRDMLGNMRYLETAIAVHGDPSFMPPHRRAWSFVNFMIDRPGHCEKTFWCGINRDVDIFRSWVTLSDRTPSNLYGMYRYHHPRMTPAYFRTQAQLAVVPPGEGGLWLAGSYLLDVDMHESGLVSAMRVIKHLHPESRNLRALQKVDVAKKFPKVARMYDLAEST